MDLQTLSSLDDLLSDVLLDGVHLWFQTHKMNKDYQPLCLPQETILHIIQKRVIIDRRVPDAVKELLKIEAIVQRLNNERLLQNFQVHARRYLNVYLPAAGFEISQTDRYSALTNKSEACVIATRVFEAGHELRFCAGSIANLTVQEEKDLEKKTSDFSVIRTSRRGTCLFLGPARFVNHDCDPNCNFMPVGADVICFKTLKPIDVNEEITTYYGDNYFGVGNQECLCATCERLGRGRYRTDNEEVEAVQTISSSIETEEGLLIRRLRTRSINPPCYTRTRLRKSPSGTKPSVKYTSIAPVESDTVPNAVLLHHAQLSTAFVPRLLSLPPDSTHQYEGSGPWLHTGSGQLTLAYEEAARTYRPNSTPALGSASPQLHTLHNDGTNNQPLPHSPVCEDSTVSQPTQTPSALNFFAVTDSVSDLSLVMDSATDTSGSSLSTPPYTDSNSDVDIDGDEKKHRDSTDLLQSVRSRMSIAFLCHGSSPSPSPGPGPTCPEQSNPYFSADVLGCGSHKIISTIDFHKSESTNTVTNPVVSIPGSMDELAGNRCCPTCKNKLRKQEQGLTADCERCHRHLSIYSVKWPLRSNGVLKEKMAKLEQSQVKIAERAMRRKEAASKTLRHQQGRRMVSNKKAHFTTHFKKAGSKATSAKMPSHLPASSILGNTEQLHQPDCVVPCRQEQTEQDLIQHSTVTFRIGGPAASTKKPTMGESVAMGNITPEVITAIGNKRPPLRKPTVHFVRHHVHMRVARIPRGIKANKEGKPNCSERELYFNSHRIMTEKVAVRFTAVPGLLFRRAVDGNSTLAALGPFPGFYADVSGSDHILYGCMPQLMELRHSDGEDRARDARNLNPSEISGVGCSFVLSKLRVDASKEFQSATKGRGIRTLTITKRKRAAVASSMTHTLCTKADFAQAEQITQSPMAATTTILHPSPLELPLATSSIPNQPAPHSQTSAKLSHVVSRDEAILFALESGLQSESGNPRTGELVHVLQRDVPDFLPVPYSVVSGTKRKASGQVRIQESPAVNPSLGLDPYWPDSWTEPMDNFSMLSSADLVSGFELSVQPWCQGPALVQGPTIQFPKRKALQNLPADGVLEPSRKRKVLEQQLQQWNANVTLSSPRHLTQDTIVFPVQNHNLRRNVGVRIASYGTTMITPKRMTSELERLSQWTIKEQVPSHGRRRAAPPRQAFGIPEMNQLDGPSTQDLATFLIGGQQEQLSSANSEIDESGPKPCVTSTMGVASELVPLDQSLEPLRPVIAKAEPAFQDSQPTSESRALLLTEPDLTIMTTKLLDTEAQSTISQPGGRNQQCRKEAYPYVDTQSEVGKASVAGAEPAPGRPPNLSKKLLSPLASDPHPSQDPGVSVLNRGSLHTKGSNRLSEVEQLQIWTIKNSEPSFVRSRRTLTLQE